MVGKAGFEPAISRVQGEREQPDFPISRNKMERPTGIEPVLKPWQGLGLPISEDRLNLERNIGFEPILSVWKTAVLAVKHQSRFEDGPNPWSRTKTACSSDRSHTVRPNWEMG